jgi:iron complex transport system substrate-binding protein
VLLRPLVAALAVVFALAACGGSDDPPAAEPAPPPPATAAPETAEAPPAAPPGEPAFPVTIEADNGSVVVEAEPERIVSLSPTATETLFAIGAGDQVVAVDDQSNYPEEAPVTNLSGFTPNVEAIASYDPDLVVAGFDAGDLVSSLEEIGVTVILQPAATDLDGAYEQIAALGAASGHVAEAEELVASMEAEIEELVAQVPAEAEGMTVYHELGPDYFSATSKTFIGSVYQLLGLANIADEATGGAPDYPQLSAEHILEADPDLIVLADTKCCGETAEKVAKRPGWDQITAVTEGNVVEADDDVASRWGPRTVDFVETIVGALEGATA